MSIAAASNIPTSTVRSSEPFVPARRHAKLHTVLRLEWPLAAFTFLIPVLVGLFSLTVFNRSAISSWPFIGLSILAVLLSSVHLGRKSRAWRAISNPATSWLSREVLLFGAFFVGGAAYLGFFTGSSPLAWVVLAVGFAALVSVDRVYSSLPLIDSLQRHSASAILTGLLLVGVFGGNPLVAATIGAGKLLLYVRRKLEFRRDAKPTRPVLSSIRVAAGIIVPTIAWIVSARESVVVVVAGVLVGELIDRLEFYAELDVVTPGKQMVIDLNRAISA